MEKIPKPRWLDSTKRHSEFPGAVHMVHNGFVDQVVAKRQSVMERAFKKHPERFSKGFVNVKKNPGEVYINYNPKVNERNIFEFSLDK